MMLDVEFLMLDEIQVKISLQMNESLISIGRIQFNLKILIKH